MADLSEIQAAQAVKIVGSDTSGIEGTPVASQATGNLLNSDIINNSGLYRTLTVGTSAVEIKVGAGRLADRKLVTIDNTSNVTIYWGYNSSITTSAYAGRIFKDQQASWAVGPNLTIYVIAGSAGNSTHISEAS